MRRRQFSCWSKNWRQRVPAYEQSVQTPRAWVQLVPVPGGSAPAGSPLGGVTHPQSTPPRCRNGAPGAWRSDLISGVRPAVVTELSRSPFPDTASPFHFHSQHPAPTPPNHPRHHSPPSPSPIPSAVVESYTPIAYLISTLH